MKAEKNLPGGSALDALHVIEDALAVVSIAVAHDEGNSAESISITIDGIVARIRDVREALAGEATP